MLLAWVHWKNKKPALWGVKTIHPISLDFIKNPSHHFQFHKQTTQSINVDFIILQSHQIGFHKQCMHPKNLNGNWVYEYVMSVRLHHMAEKSFIVAWWESHERMSKKAQKDSKYGIFSVRFAQKSFCLEQNGWKLNEFRVHLGLL